MRIKTIMSFALVSAMSSAVAQINTAQELDTVVIGTKVPIKRENSGKVISVITTDQLQNQQGSSVAQVLNQVAGIEINGSRSNDGQNLGYFVRGGRNRQVVILIDGVAQTDGSQIANDYDLRLISANSVERIEILKGASSVLYGANAGTAVISITTKKNAKKAIAANFVTSVGSNNSSEDEGLDAQRFVNSAQISGQLGKVSYRAQIDNRYARGLSAIAAPSDSLRFKADPFNYYQASASLGYQFSKSLKLNRSLVISEFDAAFDNFDFTDANNSSNSKVLTSSGQATYTYNKGRIVINDSYRWLRRETQSAFPTKFNSRTFGLDAYLNHNFTNQWSLVAGVNFAESDFNAFSVPFGTTAFAQDVNEFDANFTIFDPYVNVVYTSDFGLNINAGARLNTHSNYDNKLVYQVNPSYSFAINNTNNLKLLATYSTAYITPSLFQLYDPSFGNDQLNPEENTTIEAGAEWTSTNGVRLSAVYFTRDESNFVDFVTVDPDLFLFEYQNIDTQFTASGLELEASYRKGKWWAVANYTYTQPDDRFALRIPEHKVNLNVDYKASRKWNLGLNFNYTAARDDSFFNPTTFQSEMVVLDSYTLVEFRANYKFSEALNFFVNASNLFNTEYEELFRYQALGRNLRLGASINL